MRREILRRKSLYLPAITIIALALTLVVMVAISSYRNIRREQGRADQHLLREGKVLLNVFEERSLSEILFALLGERGWEASLQRLAEDMAHNPMLRYIFIADRNGTVVAHSQPGKIGTRIDLDLSSSGRIVLGDAVSRSKVYELVLPFKPIRNDLYAKLSSAHKTLIEENSMESALRACLKSP